MPLNAEAEAHARRRQESTVTEAHSPGASPKKLQQLMEITLERNTENGLEFVDCAKSFVRTFSCVRSLSRGVGFVPAPCFSKPHTSSRSSAFIFFAAASP